MMVVSRNVRKRMALRVANARREALVPLGKTESANLMRLLYSLLGRTVPSRDAATVA